MNASGFGRGEIRTEGGRFTLLLDDASRPGAGIGDAQREAFARGLSDLVESLPEGAPVESTLRCTEVFDGGTRESLFAPQGGELRVVARIRAHTAEDLERDPGHREITPPVALSRRGLVGLAVLFIVAFGLWAWQQGYLDRLFGADAAELEVRGGPFEDLVAAEVTSEWGKYVVKLTRGERYPVDPKAVEALVSAAVDLEARSAVNAVANGDSLWVRLENGDGRVIAAEKVDLRDLVTDAKAEIEAQLDGQIGARVVRLALSSGL